MKVISGKYKGRNIEGFSINGTRPTTDRVKESLFAMIQDKVLDSVCLDLFSGSGNLGIEALSEGAKSVYFVDKNRKAYQTICRNLEMLGEKVDNVFCCDYMKALSLLSSISFDIIFLDPPYQSDCIKKSIDYIISNHLLSSSGIIVCESDSIDKVIFPSSLEIVKMKKYGDKLVAILRYV